MLVLHPLSRTFRFLEWIYITAHFGMSFNRPDYPLSIALGFYGFFFGLSWIYPVDRPRWQRYSYILLALTVAFWARWTGVDLELLIFFYLSKSYFLLARRITIFITVFAGVIWTIFDYWVLVDRARTATFSQTDFDLQHPLNVAFFSLVIYVAASVFVLMFSDMVIQEQKSRQRADELAEQVESLATSLERTRIAREIHDSLGHTLTDLDMQLAVAQQLRFHDLEKAFRAIDTAKVLAHQCIEDVSHALDRLRQSDFDLNQALTALMEQMGNSTALHIQWEVNLPRLPVHQSYQIYCIVKEGMINVQKHARASQISFRGGLTSQGLVLDLKDDGVGFDPATQQGGFGIQGMIERVQLLGGQFTLDTASGKGTQIQVILPL
ncbi:MAG: sensor histidine kinase [Leptolyngbya sp. BL-A-14]